MTKSAMIEPITGLRQTPKVDPALVAVNSDGFKFRDIFVRLPHGTIADDLKEPEMWKHIQNGPRALRKFDRLMLVAYDESWIAEAIVAHADLSTVILAKPRITAFPDRVEKLFGDGTYQVKWSGSGYVVVRLRDEAVMTNEFPNAALAERALVAMYPRRA
ncbi:hypothetical protein LOF18_24995 [Sinorhizobium meliloti]|nr:hypothetical protein [Sinorhizobium meliloti]MDE4620638.1 hypothetical protein [Sinorhizobium meliloti]